MSTTTERPADATETAAGHLPRKDRAEPQPWRTPEDAHGWRVVARGEGRRNRPPVGGVLAVELTAEQVRWVREQAAAAGMDEFAFVARLIDDARARQSQWAQRTAG